MDPLERQQWVEITANIRRRGLPTAVHHVQRRSRRPDLKVDPRNLVGIDQVLEHTPLHDQALDVEPGLELADLWR